MYATATRNIDPGKYKKNQNYILSSPSPPYKDLTQNKIIGLVDLTMLTDDSCSNCYDVNTNKQILAGFGMKIISVDDSETKKIIPPGKIY